MRIIMAYLSHQRDTTTMHILKFDKKFFRDFWNLLKPFWVSEEKYFALSCLMGTILCIIGEVRANVAINNFSKNFYDSLQTFNKDVLLGSLYQFVLILIAYIFMAAYAAYFQGLISIRWRRWLTKNYLTKWLDNHNHYRLQIYGNNIDNPDQRISEDLESFAAATLSAFFLVFKSTLTLVTFGVILWNLSGNMVIPMGAVKMTIPGYLLWCAVLYALVGTWITSWIGNKLAALNYRQQQYNADLRYSLVRLRESSEQVALYRGEEVEKNKFYRVFDNIFSNFISMLKVNRKLIFFNNGYSTVSFIFGLTIALPLYLQKKVQLGGVMQISGAFGVVISAISIFVKEFGFFAEWRAVIYRLTEFNKSMSNLKTHDDLSINKHPHGDVLINNLNLSLPNEQILLRNLNMKILPGERYLLTGSSGTGKSTFLRALAGLWPYGKGQIYLPENARVLFLPQKPYLPQGTLKDSLLYPENINTSDEHIAKMLQLCHLQKFQNNLHEIKNWSKELSLGEQQLIAFCRIFLYQPDIIFLDEATSALDEKMEADLYKQLIERLPETTVISIGHRETLNKFHQHTVNFADVSLQSKIINEQPAYEL